MTLRWWVGLAVSVGILALVAFCLDRGTYPSRQVAENLLRHAIDGSWQVHREDGHVEAPRDDDIASIEAVDCREDNRMESDFPMFACVYHLTAVNGQREIPDLDQRGLPFVRRIQARACRPIPAVLPGRAAAA